jgi:hypothetical protein
MSRAFLRRQRDGSTIDLSIPDAVIDRARILPKHPMQSGATTTTTRQDLPIQVACTTTLSTMEIGPDEVERIRVELITSPDQWTLYTPDRPGIANLMIGTTSERRDPTDAVYLSMQLEEITTFRVTDEAIGAPQPRADAAAGLAAPEDLGTVTTQEPDAKQRSFLDNLIFGGTDG